MCGICGIYGTEKLPAARDQVSKMSEKLAHRGPDASGVWSEGNACLAHRRLSVIDPSESANQPFVSRDGRFILSYNGEIYNFRQIREELDSEFFTDCDTEVIIEAFRQWGIACLQKFNGMFAFALYDRQSEEFFLVRDRLGIKPLYWFRTDEQVYFSSEVRSLLASGAIDTRLNRDSLVDYLRYQTVHEPNTLIDGLHMLPAGHYMKLADNETHTRAFWRAEYMVSDEATNMSREEVVERVSELIGESVQSRLISDVPLGAFLSGGIDSSAIVALMAEKAQGQVKTFNVSFREEEFSEARYARMIAEKFDTDHTEIELSADHFLKTLPDALQAMDHPSGDGPNTFVVSKATRDAGITVALSGLGGDELFAGYDLFERTYRLKEETWLTSYPKWLRRLAGKAYGLRNPGMKARKFEEVLTLDYLDAEYLYPVNRRVLLDETIERLVNRGKLPADRVQAIAADGIAYGTEGFSLPWLSKISYAELSTYMKHVLLRDTDQMSMAHALEVRVPFLDHRLVEFMLGVPDRVKFPNTPKQLLVEAMGDRLPDEVVNRPKMGFTLPYDHWLKGPLKNFAEERIHSLGNRDSFDSKKVEKTWNGFLKGDKSVSWSRVWHLLVLEDWLQRHGITE